MRPASLLTVLVTRVAFVLVAIVVYLFLAEQELIEVSIVDSPHNEQTETFTNIIKSVPDVSYLSDREKVALLEHVFPGCGYPKCSVTESGGGNTEVFLYAGALINHEQDIELKIDGECASACVMAADVAREKTCITPRAVFLFHEARTFETYEIGSYQISIVTEFSDPEHSESIIDWVEKNGGFPRYTFLRMTYREALQFWRPCKGES